MRSFASAVITASLLFFGSLNLKAQSAPTITSVSADPVAQGAMECVNGTNLASTGTVKVNGSAVTSMSFSWLCFLVPSGTPIGATTVQLVTADGESNTFNFTVVAPPTVTSMTPTGGLAGTQITLTGTGFGATAGGANYVSLDGVGAFLTVVNWSDTQAVVTIPEGRDPGNHYVELVANGSYAANNPIFTLMALPIISLFDRQIRAVGSLQFIEGTSFGDTQGTSFVTLNGTPATISYWSNFHIGILIPQGTPLGTATAQVTTSLGSSNTLTFSVVSAPVFAALTPTSGPVGTQVTITGTGFGSAFGEDNFVIIGAGGPPLPVTSWSDTQVVVTIPDYGLSLGSYPLTLRSNGDTAANTPDFTIGNPGSGPLLQLSTSDTPLQVNLSSAQVLDWIHWGRISTTVPDRKDGITPLISDYTAFNGAQPSASSGNIAFSWSDGNHPSVVSESTEDIETFSTASGFQLTVPADTTLKTLNIYAEIFFGQGILHASLSDGSAVNITDQSVTDSDIGNKVYSIDFRAASAGQTLTVTFSGTASSGGVGLQAATLTPHLPVLAVTSPSAAQAFSSPATVSSTASANQFVNSITDIKITGSDGTVLEGTTSPFSGNIGPLPGGHYTATASATDSAGITNSSSPVEFDVIGQGGSLSVQKGDVVPTSFSSPIDLDAQGSADWILWGPFDNGDQIIDNPGFVLARKAGVAPLISNYKPFGNHPIRSWAFANNLFFREGNQVFFGGSELLIRGLNNGYEISVAADSTQRTLQLYVGAISARGKLTAFLSDGSAAVVTDNSFDFPSPADSNGFGGTAVYTITYSSASAGQTLTLRYTLDFDYGLGEVDLIGAALSGSPVTPVVPAPQIASITPGTSPTNTKVTIAGMNFGTSQGQSSVSFNELNGKVMSWSDTSIDVMVPAALFDGSTTQVVVNNANGTSNAVSFHVPAYQVFPSTLSIVVGQSQTVTVKDANHNIISGLSWSTSDPSIVSLSTDDPAVITGLFPGTATVYAGDVPFQVTVFPGTSVPPGTPLWTTASNPGATFIASLVPAVPSDSGVDVFTYDDTGYVSAISADGNPIWRQYVGAPASTIAIAGTQAAVNSMVRVVPDFSGNALLHSLNISQPDASDGCHSTQKITSVGPFGTSDLYTFSEKVTALFSCISPDGFMGVLNINATTQGDGIQTEIPHPSGILFVQDKDKIVVIDPAAQTQLANITLEHSTTNSLPDPGPASISPMIIAGDGNAYVAYYYVDAIITSPSVNVEHYHITYHTNVLRVGPDGSFAKINLSTWSSDQTEESSPDLPGVDPSTVVLNQVVHDTYSSSGTAIFSGPVITNAGVGVAVAAPVIQGGCADSYSGTYFTKGADDNDVSHTFNQQVGCPDFTHQHTQISFVSQDAVTSQVDVPLNSFTPSLQREDGSYIGTAIDTLAVVGPDGTPLWSKKINPDANGNGTVVQPQYATEDGGMVVTSTFPDGIGGMVLGILYTLDQNGNITGQTPDARATYSWSNNWYSSFGGALTRVSQVSVPLAATWDAILAGNPSGSPVAIQQPLFAQLDSCIDTTLKPPPSCPGVREAIWNGEKGLVKTLATPDCSVSAQTNVFDKLTQHPGLTTKKFLDYLQQKQPQFYDGTKSSANLTALCQGLTGFNNDMCSLQFALRRKTIAEYFASFQGALDAVTVGGSNPLIVFVRPGAIELSGNGDNTDNEALVFHEALHGFTALSDDAIESDLSLSSANTEVIDQYLIAHVFTCKLN
jgi:IPT/TIG domain